MPSAWLGRDRARESNRSGRQRPACGACPFGSPTRQRVRSTSSFSRAPRGSIWDADGTPGVHHVGVWVDDVVAETDGLLRAGWTLVAAQQAPDSGLGRFTYVAPPSGLILELVDAAIAPSFEAWWNDPN